MYSKERLKVLIHEDDLQVDRSILIESIVLASHFSGRGAWCIPVDRDRTSKKKSCDITKYRTDEAFISDRWRIQDETMYYDDKEIVIAVSTQQMLSITAPTLSKKLVDKQIKEMFAPVKKTLAGEHAIITNEPHMKGEDGRLISLAEFERRCHILRADTRSKIYEGKRKFCVLFGQDPVNRTWMYSIGLYGNTRAEILKRAFNAVKLWNLNRQIEPLGSNEYFDSHYNRKIPLSF